MNFRLIYAVIKTELKRFFNEPIIFSMTLARPYVWTLLLSEGIRLSISGNKGLSYISLISYCIVFTGITSAFSLSWERHQGFLKLWFIYGISNYNYIVGKLIYSCILTIFIILFSTPVFLIMNNVPDLSIFLKALPDILLAIVLVASIGLFISSLLTRMDMFGLVINFVLFPILFTSGTIYELPAGKYTTVIANFNPYRWAMEPVKCSFIGTCNTSGEVLIIRLFLMILSISLLWAAGRYLKVE